MVCFCFLLVTFVSSLFVELYFAKWETATVETNVQFCLSIFARLICNVSILFLILESRLWQIFSSIDSSKFAQLFCLDCAWLFSIVGIPFFSLSLLLTLLSLFSVSQSLLWKICIGFSFLGTKPPLSLCTSLVAASFCMPS